MRFSKRIIGVAAFAMSLILAVTVQISAVTYKDVPSWAAAAVNNVTSLGYMSGDLSGNFNPSDVVDNFEASKIIAKMAGFKSTGATAAEQEYYNNCYKKYEGYIGLYSKKFTKWNSTTNKEVAFLLEKGILTQDDLNRFVILVEGQEKLKALTKEEACMYYVKFMGKQSVAFSTAVSKAFADDSSISPNYKPYVYYLKSIGVVGGDGQNNFLPKSSVTRVVMAVMANAVYSKLNPTATAPTQPPSNVTQPPVSASTPQASSYESVTGTIAKLYSSFRAVQVNSVNSDYNNKIYIVSATGNVYINGVLKSYGDLTENMTFNGVLYNGELITVNAVSGTGQSQGTQAPATNAPSAADYSTIEGTIAGMKSENGVNTVNIEVRMLSPRGEILTETKSYIVTTATTVTRGGTSAAFSTIVKGDIVKAKISNGYAYSLELEQKYRTLTGNISAKAAPTANSLPRLSVTDANGVKYDFRIASDAKIYRKNAGYVLWNDLRIGDSVDLAAEYDVITTINAYGSYSNKDVYVKDLYICKEYSTITGTDDSGKDQVYYLIAGLIDPYSIKVGNKVRLNLDSMEVQSFTLLSDAQTTAVYGTLTYISSSRITIKDTSTAAVSYRDIIINSSTVIKDTAGNKLTYQSLYGDMVVYIEFVQGTANTAKTITILGR